jgi:hypothetical protein
MMWGLMQTPSVDTAAQPPSAACRPDTTAMNFTSSAKRAIMLSGTLSSLTPPVLRGPVLLGCCFGNQVLQPRGPATHQSELLLGRAQLDKPRMPLGDARQAALRGAQPCALRAPRGQSNRATSAAHCTRVITYIGGNRQRWVAQSLPPLTRPH